MPINFAVKLAATVAMEALQMGLQASKRTYGPRLDELTVTVADYGTPLPRFLGERRFSCPVFHAEDLKEVENNTKVKGGGKQTTYSYLATFACAIADNAIDKVLKIFFDDKLVYDATGTGPISYASSLGIDLNSVMRTYYGTEDQEPDPRYASWCEDRYGADSAPAYRGVSYLFFEELPVDNFGNRIPQISVIAVSAADAAYPNQVVSKSTTPTQGYAMSAGGQWMVDWTDDDLEWWDAPTRTNLGVHGGGGPFSGFITNVALAQDGTAYYTGWSLSNELTNLYTTPPLGTTTSAVISGGHVGAGPTRVFDFSDGTRKIYSGSQVAGYSLSTSYVSDSQCGRDFCLDGDGNTWGLFQPEGSSDEFTIKQITGGTESFTVTGSATRSDVSEAYFCHVASASHFYVVSDGYWYLIDDSDGSIKDSGTHTWLLDNFNTGVLQQSEGNHDSFWSGFKEVSLVTGAQLRTVPSGSFAGSHSPPQAFDPINTAIICDNGTNLNWCFVDRISNAGTTLGAIVSKMCDAAGLTDRDTSALTQAVKGYSWTRGDVKSQMEPVLDIHDVDACPHDWEIKFRPRGTAPSGTIDTGEFAKNGSSPRYKITEKQDTDLPRILRVNFADTEFEQQVNNVLSPLPADTVDTDRDEAIDLTTYADDPAGAQQKADRYMRRTWNSRDSIENSLTAQKLAIEPGDTTALTLDGIDWNVRLTGQTYAAGRLDCTWVRDEVDFAAINSSTAGPSMEARDEQVITMPAPIKGFVIDAPYRYDTDADVRPLLYSGAGAYGGLTFPSATIWERTGAGDSAAYDQLFATVSAGATWGMCNGTMADASANLWDRGNTLSVTLHGGSLTSCTEADIDADPALNLILVGSEAGGWEYVNFTTATLVSGTTYTLSGFKRGRRGTEWMCAEHSSGETFIFADSLDVDEMGADDIGGDFSFKAQSLGRSLDAAPAISLAYDGNTLKPYAPARIKWTTDGTDMFGEIIRRTRVGGAWNGGSAIPLSENAEEYEVDILDGATVLRTITVSGTNTFTYTGAQISADGGTVGVPPSYNAYQISDVAGRGFALAA